MSRPDPHSLRRKPMARGAAAFAIRQAHPRSGNPRPLFVDDVLDIFVLNQLLEVAEAMVEGAAYAENGQTIFSGTALLELSLSDLPLHPRDPAVARQLARALRDDRRAIPIIEARAAAAMSRLLGTRSPGAWQSSIRARAEGLRVRLDVEMDAVLDEGRALG